MVSGVSAAPAKKTAGQIEKETLKKRISNFEQGMSNFEVRYSIILNHKGQSAAIPPFDIRYSIFDILRFAVPAT
jgi:hypothetical protein